MGITKTELYTDKQVNLAAVFKALGHPARVSILEYLFKVESCVCGDIVDEIGLAQATISQHLVVLKNVGIIQGTVTGTSVCYCIDKTKWLEITEYIEPFLNSSMLDTECC
ncbi:metalloregulator ArsR/SmtB family transcription factor [Nonlabens tegetincola]|uniref:ArsR/SmtB family transcription factor n=1 Tax=Nonlabens tegetincola TaxID=323273 RepID=UPI0030C7A95B